MGAEKFWKSLQKKSFVAGLGALMMVQMQQLVHLENGIYTK
jgi:hypothetical protein